MFRVVELAYIDEDAGELQKPAAANRYTGSDFKVQTILGTRMVDETDDRVTFEASIKSSSPQAFSIGLGADDDGVGTSSVYGGTIFRGVTYGTENDTGPDDGKPRVGFPLPHIPDAEYASATGDMAGDTVNDESPFLVTPGVQWVSEKPLQEPYRLSEHPAEIQHEMPWDIVAGAWPWTGTKVTLQRPYAAAPMTFDTPLTNALPSPTGTNNADANINNVSPSPLTFRLPPEPWDTNNDGQYVDSGE